MKKLLPLIVISLLFSCSNDKGLYTNSLQEKVNQCYAFKNFEVPIREGYASIVTYGEDTLAVATEPMTILVPKSGAVRTKSESAVSVKVDYVALESVKATFSQYWQAVMFEDSEDGDYDYNDLVIHVRNWVVKENNVALQRIDIQPVAMGNNKTITLGCILPDNQERIISTDVRTELFEGKQGYINTSNNPIKFKFKNYILTPLVGTVATISWFIEVDGKRFYAVSTELDYKNYEMFNTEGMPYGLVQYSTFTYPQECRSIFKAYPEFQAWIDGERSDIGSNNSALCYKWSYIKYSYSDGTKATVWDYNSEDFK